MKPKFSSILVFTFLIWGAESGSYNIFKGNKNPPPYQSAPPVQPPPTPVQVFRPPPPPPPQPSYYNGGQHPNSKMQSKPIPHSQDDSAPPSYSQIFPSPQFRPPQNPARSLDNHSPSAPPLGPTLQSHSTGFNDYYTKMGHTSTPGKGYNPSVGSRRFSPIQSDGNVNRAVPSRLSRKETYVYVVTTAVIAGSGTILANIAANVNNNSIIPTHTHMMHNFSDPNILSNRIPSVTNNNTTIASATNNSSTAHQGYNRNILPIVVNSTGAIGPASRIRLNAPIKKPTNTSVLISDTISSPLNSSSLDSNFTDSSAPEKANNSESDDSLLITSDLYNLTEELFKMEENDRSKYITLKLQGQKLDDSIHDIAAEPLFNVRNEAYNTSTIQALLKLYDNYELDSSKKENIPKQKQEEENDFLRKIFETKIMQTAWKFLVDKKLVSEYDSEFEISLKQIWFTLFKRTPSNSGSSGFETVFLAENFDSEIIGLHNWIYYAKQEEKGNLNYIGYIKQANLGTSASIIKLRSTLQGAASPVSTIFVGTSPELEMALYTVCFYASRDKLCAVKLGGTKFIIEVTAHLVNDKVIIVSAYPEI